MLPDIVLPDLFIVLETIIPIYAGSGPVGGGVLLPGSVVQVGSPHLGDGLLFSNPLKELFATLPVIGLF